MCNNNLLYQYHIKKFHLQCTIIYFSVSDYKIDFENILYDIFNIFFQFSLKFIYYVIHKKIYFMHIDIFY